MSRAQLEACRVIRQKLYRENILLIDLDSDLEDDRCQVEDSSLVSQYIEAVQSMYGNEITSPTSTRVERVGKDTWVAKICRDTNSEGPMEILVMPSCAGNGEEEEEEEEEMDVGDEDGEGAREGENKENRNGNEGENKENGNGEEGENRGTKRKMSQRECLCTSRCQNGCAE